MGLNTRRNNRRSLRTPRTRRLPHALAGTVPSAQPTQRGPRAATYWRRRFVALVTGLAVLALISWAFSGVLGGRNGISHAGSATGRAGSGAQGKHGGSGASGQASVDATASATATRPHASATVAHAHASVAAHDQHGGRAAYGHSHPCPAGAVVLSLFSSQDGYSASQLPHFDVDVVSTAPHACTFNVGAKHVKLIVKAGSVRVWSSADCAQGTGSLVTDLQRGVPTVLPISWNRQASAPGCPSGTSRMPTGTYTATVTDGSEASDPVSFRIS